MGKIIENYSLQSQLGSGVYSRVYKAINLKTKQQVAIKMVKAEKFKELPKLEEGTVNQINILTNLEYCPHIIRYYDMLKTVNNFYFVYQFCNGGTLENYLKKQGPLPQKTALNYFSQILQAFKILNKNNIMHRDLKPQNILMHDGILKLADFGFCKPMQNEHQTTQTMLGSPIYMAPQILNGQQYTIKADIWSLGVVLFRMLYGFCPFESNNIGKLITIIKEQDLNIPSSPPVSAKVQALLRKMICKDAKHRADWSQIFTYQIKGGEIISNKQIKSSKYLTDSGMKKSCNTSNQSTSTPRMEYSGNISYQSRDYPKKSQDLMTSSSGSGNQQYSYNQNKLNIDLQNKMNVNQDLMYNPKQNPMRNTYTSKSPIRQNLKKDMLLKNHSKCIQLMSLVINLSQYQNSDSLILSYIFTKNVQKELIMILESIRKQCDLRSADQMFMKNFFSFVDQQIDQIKNNLAMFQDQIKNTSNISLELIEMRKKMCLKNFINSLKLENFNQLVLASRVIDLIQDSLVIKKQTYDKMSRQQLTKKIKEKLQNMRQF